MKSSYKKLKDFIVEKVEFNEGNKYSLLQGVSNKKYFQKAKTNIIDVDLTKYRVAHYDQFVFNRATTRNGEKISVALRKGESCIVSPSYRIFEVADTNILHPDYLMMWFSRPEFDRYARFKSHGSAHEFFDMDEMRDIELPIPNIEKQKELIAEYEVIENRIQLNKKLCATLEETAQTIYKHWFEDFEFPDENGNPYKSSGGEMVECEELGREIPKAFKLYKIIDLVEDSLGGDWGKDVATGNYSEKVICVRGADINLMKYGNFENAPVRYIIKKNLLSRNLKKDNIVIELSGGSPTQSTGRSIQISEKLVNEINENLICSNFCRALQIKNNFSDVVFAKLNFEYDRDTFFRYENSSHGVKNLNIGDLFNDLMIATNESLLKEFSQNVNIIKNKVLTLGIQNQKLEELKSLLLAKMAVEN